MAVVQGSGSGGTTKKQATNNYWENYAKYNQPKPKTTPSYQPAGVTDPRAYQTTTPSKTTATKPIISATSPITTSPAPKPAASPTVAIAPKPAAVEPTVKSAPITESASANLISGTPRTVKPETTEPAGLTAAEVQAMLDKQEARFQARQESENQRRIDELVAAQKRAQIAALDKAMSNSLGNLADEEAGIDPMYYDARNQVQGQSDVGALNFAQYMAGRGIKGAAAGMPEIYRNAGLQGQIGGLNRQEQAARDRIARNRTGIQNAYEADVAAANAGADAKGLEAFISQMNADRLFSLNEAGITGKYGGKPTLAGQEFQQKLDDTAKQSWLDTRDRFSDNYQQEINNLQNDNDTTNDWRIPYLESDRQGKIQKEAEQTAAQATAASEAERTAYLDALNAWKISGTANEQMASILGVPVGARTADYDIDKINAATSQQNANTAAKNANTAQTKTETPKPDDSYSGYMSKAIGLMNSDSSPEQIIAYIKSLPISAEQKAQMANDLGL